ncbi:MAG TPA: hypothetical protein VF101_13035 [Gaiellaceae bacterium]
MRGARSALALGYWLWAVGIAAGAGFLGTGLNCEGGEGCVSGPASWLEPWTWGEHYVYPDAGIAGLVALVPASGFLVFAILGRWWPAAVAFVASLPLLSYAFFGGLTREGRAILSFGPLLGVAALGVMRSQE